MKRRDLIKKLRQMAAAEGLTLGITEGGNHTKVTIGNRRSTLPRHREINENTARSILADMAPTQDEGPDDDKKEG